MLSKQQNERLTQVGPGTPCGELMRRYWLPIAPYSLLLNNPVRKVRVLGEDLVLYKDKSGTLGLIGDRCLHRKVDLQFGIPDECGLRCPYHGWLFDETGACVERPMENSPKAEVKQKLKGYPVQELGGLVFAYMGPLPAPAVPRWDLLVWPNAIRQIAINVIDCNWLQCQENTGDPTHSAYVHGHLFNYVLEKQGELNQRSGDKLHTMHQRKRVGIGIKEIYAQQTEHGFRKGIRYSKALGADSDKDQEHSTVIFPFYTQTGTTGAPRSEYQIRVPIDDTHTTLTPTISAINATQRLAASRRPNKISCPTTCRQPMTRKASRFSITFWRRMQSSGWRRDLSWIARQNYSAAPTSPSWSSAANLKNRSSASNKASNR